MTDAPTYIQIRAVELPLGEQLPWDLVDARGTLVLRQGTLIAREEQVERLLERRVCRERTAADIEVATSLPATAPVFEQLLGLKRELRDCLQAIVQPGAGISLDPLCAIAGRVRHLAWKYPDAMLGGLQLDHAANYTDLHPLLVAVIAELIARRLAISDAARTSLCCAALSSNLGMLGLQDALSRQAEPLDDGQRRAVRDHPEQSFELLRALGVNDEIWLAIVLNHHERGDGSGYPHGCADPEIDQMTSIVALADNYAAMVLPRAYRDGMHAQQAMREIFVQRRIQVAGELVQQFVKELGVYPPGAFVTMKNGDQGLVIKRGLRSANAPVVSCFANIDQVPYATPLIRDTGEPGGHTIAAIAAPRELSLPLQKLWGMVR
jgi:HD-GYP domain-containing protein (c-di-GMP phosphodiesterase class II)